MGEDQRKPDASFEESSPNGVKRPCLILNSIKLCIYIMYVICVYKTHVECHPSEKFVGDLVLKDFIGAALEGTLLLVRTKISESQRENRCPA